jgi:hypothetical protein
MSQINNTNICKLLRLFLEFDNDVIDQDYFLSIKHYATFDKLAMDAAIDQGLVKFFPLKKGCAGFNGYMIKPKGRLYLKRHTTL